jgi:hypothetical protein
MNSDMMLEVYPCDKCGHIVNNHDAYINTDRKICWCGCQRFYIDNLKFLEQQYERSEKV